MPALPADDPPDRGDVYMREAVADSRLCLVCVQAGAVLMIPEKDITMGVAELRIALIFRDMADCGLIQDDTAEITIEATKPRPDPSIWVRLVRFLFPVPTSAAGITYTISLDARPHFQRWHAEAWAKTVLPDGWK
jgi:hypothetical protein